MTKADVLKQFEALRGIGKAKAELLYEHGYTSMEKLQKASVDDLAAIKGFTRKVAEDLHKQVGGKKEPAKKPAKKEAAKEAETEEKKEPATGKPDVTIVEPGEKTYSAKRKPTLSKDQQRKLVIRRQIKDRTPHFLRDEGFRYKKLAKTWRRPTGYTSKLRINLKYRPSKVRIGFGSPRDVRGLHASGFREVPVHTVKDLEGIDPKTQAARIGSTVGTRKRLAIAKRADELQIRILNLKR